MIAENQLEIILDRMLGYPVDLDWRQNDSFERKADSWMVHPNPGVTGI